MKTMLLSSVAAARWTRSGETAAYLKLPEDIDDSSSSESRTKRVIMFWGKVQLLFGNKWSKCGLATYPEWTPVFSSLSVEVRLTTTLLMRPVERIGSDQ